MRRAIAFAVSVTFLAFIVFWWNASSEAIEYKTILVERSGLIETEIFPGSSRISKIFTSKLIYLEERNGDSYIVPYSDELEQLRFNGLKSIRLLIRAGEVIGSHIIR